MYVRLTQVLVTKQVENSPTDKCRPKRTHPQECILASGKPVSIKFDRCSQGYRHHYLNCL